MAVDCEPRRFTPTCPMRGAECGNLEISFVHAVLCGDVNLDGVDDEFLEKLV